MHNPFPCDGGFRAARVASPRHRRDTMTTTVRRSFSGFLTHEGKIETNLAASVPTVANWLLSELPQFSPWRHHITNPHRRAPTVPECLDEFFQRGNESDDRSNQPG